MKIRADIVRMYKDIHGWVGILSGLALFIAFYAGAITMFEEPLQRWASPPSRLAPAPSLDATPELVAKAIAAHPEAAKRYVIHLRTSPAEPGRMSWPLAEGNDEHGLVPQAYASLASDGSLQIETSGPSPVAQFIDVLHQQVGLPFAHEISMPIMGAICLLYAIALVSGLIVLLPSLIKDLFALRIGRNVKRMWLDVHNVLGVFSLPFHLVMALTSIVFAFHDQFYDAQAVAFAPPAAVTRPAASAHPPEPELPPAEIVRRLKAEAPTFAVSTLTYSEGRDGRTGLRVAGADPRYGLRGPTFGVAPVDPASGRILNTDYMPGRQDGWGATITSFFALHFGNFGGAPIRWAYFLLGLAGAFLFYTGNLLWIESRRKRERKAGAVEQSRSTRVLGALTVGVPLGCIAGISVTVAAARLFGEAVTYSMHSALYYAVFLLFTAWALVRGAARAGAELAGATALAMLCIPLASLIRATIPDAEAGLFLIDLTAIVIAGLLATISRSTRRRADAGPVDSIWTNKAAAGHPNAQRQRGMQP